MNLKQLSTFGSGMIFPIQLTTPKDAQGNDEFIEQPDGSKIKKVGWYPKSGLILIKNNLTALFIYQIGQRFRQENFGSRLWECIEEQNTVLLEHMTREFVTTSIQQWESRIKAIEVSSFRQDSQLFIQVKFATDLDNQGEAVLQYDHSTNTSYAY